MTRTYGAPSYVTFSQKWHSAGEGRYWKRRLAKARRRAWRNPGHARGLLHYETLVNWKNW